MNADSGNGVVNVASRHSVDETVEKSRACSRQKGSSYLRS